MEIREYLIPRDGYKDLLYAVNLSYTVLEAGMRTVLFLEGSSYVQFPKLHCFLYHLERTTFRHDLARLNKLMQLDENSSESLEALKKAGY